MSDEELATLDELPPLKNEKKFSVEAQWRYNFDKMCRGELEVDQKMASTVYCYYKADKPFLRIAPFKVEILRFAPLVVLFKDVISDAEIEVVQKLATPRVSVKVVTFYKLQFLEQTNKQEN